MKSLSKENRTLYFNIIFISHDAKQTVININELNSVMMRSITIVSNNGVL